MKVKDKCRRRHVGFASRVGVGEVGFARMAQAQRNMCLKDREGMKSPWLLGGHGVTPGVEQPVHCN